MYGFRDAELQHAAWQMRCAVHAQAYMHMHMCMCMCTCNMHMCSMADALRGARAGVCCVVARRGSAIS
jgi:hypothetical protein